MGDPTIPEDPEKKKDAVKENNKPEKKKKGRKERVYPSFGEIPR
ncbi:MAG: hypothetical protein WBA22_02300 [Candidatus Methanofastidiosia archaeon]